MAYIPLKRRRREQPTGATPLDKSHWLAKDVTFAITGDSPWFNSATETPVSVAGVGAGVGQRGTKHGNALYTPNGGWADIAVNQDWAGPNTIIALCRINNIDTWGGFFSKDSSGTSTQLAMGQENSTGSLYGSVENGTAVSFGGGTIAALANFSVVAFTHSGVASTAMSYYRNGALVGSTSALGTQNAGTGVLGLGRSRDSSFSFDSDVDWINFIRVKRVLSPAEIAEFTLSPWELWKPRTRKIQIATSSGSTGTVAVTNANDTSSASGTTTVVGTSAKTNANDTSSASGTTTVVGSSATTNAADTSAASGTTTVTGSSATTNANDTSTASGAVGSSVSGTVAYTNLSDTSSASGTTTATGSVATTNANDTSSASGTTTIVGSSAVTNANDTSLASGLVGSVTGTVAYTNEGDTCVARGSAGNPVVESSGGYLYVSREEHAERRKKQRINLGIEEEEILIPPDSGVLKTHAAEQFEFSNLTQEKPKNRPIPARQQKKLEQEAVNAELKQLLQLEIEREEETILRMLMEL